ncbi:hypothetical protein HPB47_025430 [Ixodes persulcatus]|uniref:Uncharacterized protein n=1 Tax=Ixodes persulcatus TaxID=34615 RepID=A0AC60Q1W9_IXOPE|nr:hypothetical protein HPB47_025430 [Ixodes persulcatus]
MPLQRNAAVCELHFDKQFVSRHFEHVVDGQSVLIERARPFLLPGAVPTVFPNVPSYLSKPVPKKRNPKERLCPPPALHDKRQRMDEVLQPLPGEEPDEPATTTTEPRLAFGKARVQWCTIEGCSSVRRKARVVTVTDDTVTHEVFVRGVKVVLDEPGDPSSILQAVDSMHVCSGAGFLEEFPFARSHSNLTVWNGSLYNKKCTGTSSERCVTCKYLRKILINQRCRRKKTKSETHLARKIKSKTQAARRLKAKVKSLDEKVAQLKAENEKIEEAALLRKIDNLPPKQKAAILQCFEAANRKSPKGMRYSSEWVLECVIMHEMKLSENFGVAQGTGKIDGFVDLGAFTPDHDKTFLTAVNCLSFHNLVKALDTGNCVGGALTSLVGVNEATNQVDVLIGNGKLDEASSVLDKSELGDHVYPQKTSDARADDFVARGRVNGDQRHLDLFRRGIAEWLQSRRRELSVEGTDTENVSNSAKWFISQTAFKYPRNSFPSTLYR